MTGGDVIKGSISSIVAGNGKTVVIYSGNANTQTLAGLVANGTTSQNKGYATNASGGAGVVNTAKALNIFYRVTPTLTGNATASNKVYDTTNLASVQVGTGGFIDGDTSTSTYVNGVFSSAAAGTNVAICVSCTTVYGSASNNTIAGYVMSSASFSGLQANITKATVTVGNVTASNKVYDTTTNAVISNVGVATVLLGNTSAANGTLANATTYSNYTVNGSFANASAGNQTVNLNVALGDTTNYTVSTAGQNSTLATIAKANVTVSNVAVSDKVYDTTTNAALSNGNVTVQLGNATAANGSVANAAAYTNLTLIGGFANASAGINKSVNLNITLSDTTNYTLSGTTQLNTTANIAKATVTVVNMTASNKVYDTTTNAAISNVGAATALLGNVSTANGSLANATAYNNYTVNGSFANAAAGNQVVILAAVLGDTTNYTISTASQGNTTATIAKANVTVANVTVSDKVYDTTTNAALSHGNVTVQLGNASAANGSLANAMAFGNYTFNGAFANASAGSNKLVSLNVTLADTTNYTLSGATHQSVTANIAKANVTVANVTASNKVYDTTTNAAISNVGAATVLLGNASAANGTLASATTYSNYTVNGSYANAAAGSQTVSLNVALGDTTNYAFSGTSQLNTTANIAKANVVLSNATVSDKVYDTTTNALLNPGSAQVQLGNASAANGSVMNATSYTNLAWTGGFVNASAGGNKTVNLNIAVVDTTNYAFSGSSQLTTTANIAKANVTVVNMAASNKVYDTTTNAAISNVGVATLLLGNVSAANGSLANATAYSNYSVNGAFANAAAGNQTVILTAVLGDTTNYAVSTASQSNTTAAIAKANVTVANVTASSKVYDTTTNAAISNVGAATVLLGNASAANGTLAAATSYNNYTVNGSYANAAAGSQMVSLNVALGDTTNYALSTASQTNTTATIAKANVTVANVTVSDKVYDTTTNAAISHSDSTVQLGNATAANGSLANAVAYTNLALSGGFANASAGSNTTVNLNIALSDTTNYTLSGTTQVNTVANIAKANVTVANVAASNKVYDTTTNAAISSVGAATVLLGNAGAANGSLANATAFSNYTVNGSYANAAAGSQTVNLNVALGDTTNYTVSTSSQNSTTATIAKANVTVGNVSVSNKVYDTTTSAAINNVGAGTVLLGNASAANGSLANAAAYSNYTVNGSFANAAAGNQAVTLTTVLADTTNYTLSGVTQKNTTATIAKANVTVGNVTAFGKVYDTTTNAAISNVGAATVQLGNVAAANGSLANATGYSSYTVSGTFVNASAGNQTVTLTSVLGDTTNYTLSSTTQTTTVATVAKANVTVGNVSASDKVYDTTSNAFISNVGVATAQLGNASAANGSLAGAASYTNLTLLGSFANASAGSNKAVNYNVALLDTTNYTLVGAVQRNTTANIAKANVTVVGVTAFDKVYDTTTNAAINSVGAGTVQLGNASAANGSLAGAMGYNSYTVNGSFANGSAGNQTVSLTTVLGDTTNYAVSTASQNTTAAAIAKANVTVANVAASNKVYDTTTNAAISNVGAATVLLGNASAANGSLAAATSYNNYTVNGSYANAAAGSQTVNLNVALGDTTNYTFSSTTQNYTRANIAQASVVVSNASVSDKVYDTTTNASLVTGSALVQLGNAAAANGSLANAAAYTNLTLTGGFVNASAGMNKVVNVNVALMDTTNYTLSGATQVNTTASIAKANVTVANVTASNKVYDTTTNASVSNVGSATVQLGNASAANGSLASAVGYSNYAVTGAFLNATAGSQTVNLTTVLGDTTNYTLSSGSQNNTTASIAKANVTVANMTAFDKVYDTTTNASISNVGNATVQLGNASATNGSLAAASAYSNYVVTGAFANGTAGNQKVNLTTVLGDTANYSLSNATQLTTTATIAKANVGVANVSAFDKVYDTTTNASISHSDVTVQLGNALAANGSLANVAVYTNLTLTAGFANGSAGANKTVNLNLSLLDAANYTLLSTAQQSTTANIAKANVTVSNVMASNKVYDTTTNAAISSVGVATVLLGNATSANGSLANATAYSNYVVNGTFANAAAGSQAVNLTPVLGDTTNYTFSAASQTNTTATIAKANVTVANVSASDKVYDTTTNAALSGGNVTAQLGNATAANGSLASATAYGNYAITGAFANASAGNNQNVSLTTVLSDTTNYTLSSSAQTGTTANIAKANVTVANIAVFDKVYDTTTNAAISNVGAATVQLGNASAANGSLANAMAYTNYAVSGRFANASAGNQMVNLTTILADATNYSLSGVTQRSTTANIAKANVVVNNAAVADKVYDTTTNASLLPSSAQVQLGNAALANGSLVSAVAYTNLTLAGGFANASAGTNKEVNLNIGLLDTTNYTLSGTTQFNTTANIAKASVTVSNVTSYNKVYDTTTNAAISNIGAATVQLGNASTANGSLATATAYSNYNVNGMFANGSAGTQTVSLNTLLGDATNYTVSSSSQTTTTATIAKANVTVSNVAASDKVYDTTTNAAISNVGVGTVLLGNATAANGSLAGASAYGNYLVSGTFGNASAGSQTVSLTTVLGDTQNYTLSGVTQKTATSNIAKASVALSNATVSDKVYDTTTNASLILGSAQVQLGNASAANGSLANAMAYTNLTLMGGFANASAGANKAVNLSIGLVDTTNYTLVGTTQVSTTANIAKANVVLSHATVSDKVYDTTTNAVLTAGSAQVQLGNASAANGSLANAMAYTNLAFSGGFVNASAGTNKVVNLSVALVDTTNYTLTGTAQVNTTANIAQASVTVSNVTASNKVYDTTANALISNTGGATVQLGNASAANGSLANASAYGNYTVNGVFANAAAGNQAVNLTAILGDATNYTLSSTTQKTAMATIAKANVTLSNVTAFNKVYDMTTNAAINNVGAATVQLGNAAAANGALASATGYSNYLVSGAFANGSAGSQAVNLTTVLGDSTNYTLSNATQASTTAAISKANIVVSNPSVSDKVYDTTTNASLAPGSAQVQLGNASTANGSLAGATNYANLALTGGFANASADSNKTVNLTVALSDTVNYTLSGVTQVNTTASITKANVTVANVVVANKVYDTTTNAVINNVGAATVQLGNASSANGSLAGPSAFGNYAVNGVFANAGAGNQTVNLTTVLGDTTNYAVSTASQNTTTATIAKAGVTVSNVTASNKVYDTTTNATITNVGVASVQLGNAAAANGALAAATSYSNYIVSGSFANGSAGSQMVNLNVALGDSANYAVSTASQANTGATIAKANIVVSNATVSDKVYDTTTNASLTSGSALVQLGNASAANGSLAGATAYTNLTLTGGFADAAAGNNKIVNLNVALSDATNYTLAGTTQLNTIANIAKANVLVSNVVVNGKVYDMTTAASIASPGLGTVFLGNSMAANGSLAGPSSYNGYTVTGAFDNAAAGIQTVNLMTALADPTNYSIAVGSQRTTMATISKAPVVFSNVTVADKNYDGTTGATVIWSSGSVSYGDSGRADGTLIAPIPFTGYGMRASFMDPSAGTAKLVNLNAILFDPANYTVASLPLFTTASILNNQGVNRTDQIGSGTISSGGQTIWMQSVTTPLVVTTLNSSDPSKAVQSAPQATPWVAEQFDKAVNKSLFSINGSGVKQ
ncbi:hypothetical protein C798_06305 [Herbaspirillum rubrisubalbicans Os34]|uniref:YDG domain-containing protein n=1 Tax=Herbaspirillum rubrisubalbicans Os34 TaxID=1235827 RepID=A0A6M3ZMJ5_9BURK|nr:hypothetical protein C798_06305 [Herbaspirillum rubrisubalbicans Os34]